MDASIASGEVGAGFLPTLNLREWRLFADAEFAEGEFEEGV